MSGLALIILPFFLIILLGWLLAYFKLVKTDVSGSLMQYVFYAAGPAITIYALTDYHLSQLLYWRFWLGYLGCALLVMFGTAIVFKKILHRNGYWSFLAGSAAASKNAVMIAFPVFAGIVGNRAVIPMAIVIILYFSVMTPPVLFLFEMYVQKDNYNKRKVLLSALKGILTNPMIISVIVGLCLALLHITLPKFLESFMKTLGDSIIPCALFAVGLSLRDFKVKGNALDISLITVVNLILAPTIAIFLAKALELSPFYAVALVIFSAVPIAKTLYVFAGKYHVYEQETAAVVSLTTVLSIITIPLYVYIAKLLWPSVFLHI